MSLSAKDMKLTQDELTALQALKPGLTKMPAAAAVTHVMGHGAMQTYAGDDAPIVAVTAMQKRHDAAMRAPGMMHHMHGMFTKLQAMTNAFFYRLEPTFHYLIDSSLMAYLTFPGNNIGKMYNNGYQPSDLPAAITFMGQFIDHDLTKNATNLVIPEPGDVEDVASPYIDLDSVYGPRSDVNNSTVPPLTPDGRFVLTKLDSTNNAYDVPRICGVAQLPDGRNDENQMILQVHLLLMRVHNILIKEFNLDGVSAKRETIFNWQSVLIHDHLPSVLDNNVLAQVITDLKYELQHPGQGNVRHRPHNGALGMPHEFAIGFRYGHSQLRNEYFVSANNSFPLFNNLDPGPDYADLRGNRPLKPESLSGVTALKTLYFRTL